MSSEEGRRSLRSADSMTCVVRRAYSNFGHRCFAATGPRLWKSVPAGLRQMDIGDELFKRLLKTCLFGRCGLTALQLFVLIVPLFTYFGPVNTICIELPYHIQLKKA